MRTLPRCRHIALILLASLPAACAAPEPQSPFAGTWSGAERHQISFRDNTVVQQPASGPATALGPDTCSGRFRFTYARRNRDVLIALAPEQPDLRSRLTLLLVRPDYPVAELGCGEGGTTYVLVDDRNLIAIHRDADVAGIEQLSRSQRTAEQYRMEARLKSGIWVKALIRRCDIAAIGVAVVARGDNDAGAILLKLNGRDAGCAVLSQTRRPDGTLVWMRATGAAPVPEADADSYIARQRGRDPDLWIIEIDNASPDAVLDGPILA